MPAVDSSLAARLPERPVAVIYSKSSVGNRFTATPVASDLYKGRTTSVRIDRYPGFDQAVAGVREVQQKKIPAGVPVYRNAWAILQDDTTWLATPLGSIAEDDRRGPDASNPSTKFPFGFDPKRTSAIYRVVPELRALVTGDGEVVTKFT